MYEHGRCSEFLEFPFCGNHRHDHPFLGGWVQTNFMGIFLSSADKPRFLATKGFGEEAAGAEFHNIPCTALLPCSVLLAHCALIRCTARGHNGSHNGSQCSMFIGHTHTTWVTMGLTMVRGKRRGSHGFGQMLCFKLSMSGVHRCYLFVRHCVSACLACSWTFDVLLWLQRNSMGDILKEGN